MATTLIKFRRGAGNWWDGTNKPSGVTGYTNGIVEYGTTNSVNYQVDNTTTPTTRTFNQLGVSTGEPWVNMTTSQLWIDNEVINPEIIVKFNNNIVSPTWTFDEYYKVQKVFNLSYSSSDEFLKNVTTFHTPEQTSSTAEADFSAIMTELFGESVTCTAQWMSSGEHANMWQVSFGGKTYYFEPDSNYLGFVWNIGNDVVSPTFLLIPDTNTDTHWTSMNVVGASGATANTTSALTNGNVYINHVEQTGTNTFTNTSHHLISGSNGIEVTAAANTGNITISHTNSVIGGESSTSISATGSSFTENTLTYDDEGHITNKGSVTVNNNLGTTSDTASSVPDTHDYVQGIITNKNTVSYSETFFVGTSGENTLEYSGNSPIAATDVLNIGGTDYTVSAVNGNEIELTQNLSSDVSSSTVVTWTKTPASVNTVFFQQKGITPSTNNNTYVGSMITFKQAGSGESVKADDYTKTILMNVDIIDGGTFDN